MHDITPFPAAKLNPKFFGTRLHEAISKILLPLNFSAIIMGIFLDCTVRAEKFHTSAYALSVISEITSPTNYFSHVIYTEDYVAASFISTERKKKRVIRPVKDPEQRQVMR